MQVYVQKSTSTTFPRSPSAESGVVLSHAVAPRSARSSLSPAMPIPRTRDLVAPSMPTSSPAMVAAAVERKRRRSWLMRTSRRLLDHSCHDSRMRKERHVTRFYLGRRRLHAFGVEPLEFGLDVFVVLRHDVPRRNRLPRRLVHGRAKYAADDRLLRGRRHAGLGHRDISGEELVKPRGVDVEKTGLVGSESGAELRGI